MHGLGSATPANAEFFPALSGILPSRADCQLGAALIQMHQEAKKS